jgi:alpha-L-arabinofuranosidase
MASALWVLDFMYTLAANGCSGVNMETGVNHLDFVSSYSPIGEDGSGHFPAKPEYYGMLAFALGGKGKLLRTAFDPASDALKAYATQSEHGTLVLTMINKGAAAAAVDVEVTGLPHSRSATIVRLTAAAVDATDGIKLGGAEVTPQGRWRPVHAESLPVNTGRLSLSLPGFSAAVCTVR